MIGGREFGVFRELLDANHRFVLTTHVNPDGDAIGSEFGLARFVRAAGKSVRIVNQDRTPATMRFLEDDTLRAELFDPDRGADVLESADLVVLLDNSAPDRLGVMEGAMAAVRDRVLCIDHHPTRGTPWKHNILDEAACATAEIIYELILRHSGEVDAEVANALFVGVATDTGFFRFNSTTSRAYEIAARLMRAGVQPARCYQELYERNSVAYTRLLGAALADLRVEAEGAVAWVRLTKDMIARYRAEEVDVSEMTTPLLALDKVRIAVLFREIEGGRTKVSLRSKGDLDVRLLAAEFGGGGHRNASGIVLPGNLDEVATRVVRRASELALASG